MKKNGEAVKKGYLKKMYQATFLHVKDVFSDTIKSGVKNAEDLHGIKIKTQKKLDDIMDDIVIANNRAKSNIRATAKELKDVAQAAWKQAVAVALHEAEEKAGTGEYEDLDLDNFDLDDDDFFKEFDINFDEDEIDDDDSEPASEAYFSVETISKTNVNTLVYLFLAELYRLGKSLPEETLANDNLLNHLVNFIGVAVTKPDGPLGFNSIADKVVDDVPIVKEETEVEKIEAETIKSNVRTVIKRADINDMLKRPKIGLEMIDYYGIDTSVSLDDFDIETVTDIASCGDSAKKLLKVVDLDLLTNPEKIAILNVIYQRLEMLLIAAQSAYEFERGEDTDNLRSDALYDKIYYILKTTRGITSINMFIAFTCGLVDNKYIEIANRLISIKDSLLDNSNI